MPIVRHIQQQGNLDASPSWKQVMDTASPAGLDLGCRAICNAPWASLKSAFLRSMILSEPIGSISPMSPVWNQPSLSRTSAVFFSSCNQGMTGPITL